jgi:ornithine carbamoyltransferase
LVSKIAGIEFAIAAPEEFRPADSILNYANGTGKISWTKDPKEALDGADFIYTDVWVSMGFEEEAKERMRILQPYQLNGKQLALAKKDVSVMHCLPAHRGEEITDEVMDSPNSIVFDEAENRLHIQKAIMATLMPE